MDTKRALISQEAWHLISTLFNYCAVQDNTLCLLLYTNTPHRS